MLRKIMIKLLKFFIRNRPIPGIDWHYSRHCPNCGNSSGHVTNGGVNGTQHCYTCGRVSTPPRLKEKTLKECVSSSLDHWRRHPIIPYNWYELDEDQRWAILRS